MTERQTHHGDRPAKARTGGRPSAHAEAGLVGKILVIWLLIAAGVVVALYDAGSIMLARVRVADVATQAAHTAADVYRTTQDVRQACAAAAQTVEEANPDLHATRQRWCAVDPTTGDATIRLRTTANTLVAGRLPFTKDLILIRGTETGGPSAF